MPSFPSTPEFDPQKGSFAEPTQKTESHVAGDGGVRVYVPPFKKRFNLKLLLTQSGVSTLLALYEANKVTPIDFTWVEDGLVYSVYFEGRPELRPDENMHWEAAVRLGQA